MRLRLAYAMELTLALAVGLAVAKFISRPSVFDRSMALRMFFLAGPVLSGMGLVEGLCLWVERARSHGPSAWGIGRWTWSITAALIVLVGLETVALTGPEWWRDLIGSIGKFSMSRTNWVPLAIWGTARLARLPSGGPADAREWSGRVFAGLFVAWGIVYRLSCFWLA